MGLFGRKGSKASDTPISPTSNGSLKSPVFPPVFPKSNGGLPPKPSGSMVVDMPKPPDPALDPAAYLRSIYAVRERSGFVYEKAKRNQLHHFNVDMEKFEETAQYVVSIIKRDYGSDYHSIPPHGRWQHFEVGGRPRVDQLIAAWPSTVDAHERTRRLIDLFLVSVLLDAGAGSQWQYKSKESGRFYRRSEGLAVASLEMFKSGFFSANHDEPFRVDSARLKQIDVASMTRALQVSESNPMVGLEGRTGLLVRLGDALLRNASIWGKDGRPGNMIDYLISHPSAQASSVPVVPLPIFWSVLMDGLAPIWPSSRAEIDGIPLGDAWPCNAMPSHQEAQPWESIVPFHKLTQWLAYSLMTPMNKMLNVFFAGSELLTGLPEYRNGGLLIDTGLLTLKPADMKRGLDQYQFNAQTKGQPNVEVVPLFGAEDDVVVEWRAATVGFLDELLVAVNELLRLKGHDALSLAQMLEAGTWKGGRELAEVSRPNTKAPPIMIKSDGTVF